MRIVRGFFHGVGSTIKWLLIIGALIIVVVIIAAIVGIGKESEKSEKSSQQVTPAKYAAVKDGQSEAEVRALLGKPEETDTINVKGFGKSDCWYYGILAQQTTQICFQGGAVDYKAQYGSRSP